MICGGDALASANFSLEGTLWERASIQSKCQPDPLLLYALALHESRVELPEGYVVPHPFALRNGPSGSHYPDSLIKAKEALARFIQEDKLTDIGIMQVNYRWNGQRVASPEMLLDPEVNALVGAQILCESIAAAKGDLIRAIGGYHTRNPLREEDAREYASSVLSIWRSLQRLK